MTGGAGIRLKERGCAKKSGGNAEKSGDATKRAGEAVWGTRCGFVSADGTPWRRQRLPCSRIGGRADIWADLGPFGRSTLRKKSGETFHRWPSSVMTVTDFLL